METSGPGETPHEFDENRPNGNNELPSNGSSFEGMEPSESLIIPGDGRPATEHEPEWLEPPAPETPFGVERFEPVQPQLEGDPPTKFLLETSGKVRNAVDRVDRDYGLFHDREMAYDAEGNIIGHVDGLELVHQTPEGTVDVVISGNTSSVSGPSIQLRFTAADGQATYARYVGHEEWWPDDEMRMSVLHSDQYYPTAGAPWAVPADVPLRDALQWRVQDQEWATDMVQHRLENDEPLSFPWVGPEEATYIAEILTHAKPVANTLDDVADTMSREYHEETLEGPPHMAEADNARMGFSLLHDTYRGQLMTADQMISGQSDTTQEFSDGPLTTKVYAGQIRTEGGPISTLAIHRVGDSTGEAAARILARAGIEGPAPEAPITIAEDIWIGETDSGLDGRYRLRIGGHEDIVSYRLQPTAATMKALRSYLFAGEAYEARQPADGEPND